MIILHKYQEEAAKVVIAALLAAGIALMVMASGLGKTVTVASVLKKLGYKKRALFLCHDKDILNQARAEFELVLGKECSMGMFTGVEKNFHEVDILFATFQTMRDWKHVFYFDEFETLLVDESHHGQAPTYKEVIQYFKPKNLFKIFSLKLV